MSVLPQAITPAAVPGEGSDPTFNDAVARLLSLESGLALTSEAIPDVTLRIDDAFLERFRHVTVGELIETVKAMPLQDDPPKRHLQPVPGSLSDLRSLLSDREFQVVRLVAEGLSNKEISIRLALSDKTVKNHISHILAKMNLSARTQVAIHALRAGIV